MKRRRKMSALQKKFFGKKKKSAKRKKIMVVKKYMARRRSYRRSISRRIGGGLGSKSMLAPIIGGVADSYLDPMLPVDGIGASAVGIFMHDNALKTIGLYKVGTSLGNILPLPRAGTGGQGGLY